MTGTTSIIGLPVPSTDPIFLAIMVVHIGFGLAAVVTGLLAMLSRKGRGRHASWGKVYFWCLSGLCATMAALAVMRWAEDYPLFLLGTLAFASAWAGRRLRRRPRLHLAAMGVSYIVMLTAFYVDNGKALPLWKELPAFAYWILPAAIGVPLIALAWLRHPLARRRAER
ncbi:MAG: DUF2306 domain-containing protein [Sphingomonas sp.]|jgi:hypothetical protein|uniref:DUF2306 domain-containing protein n=1 Tax=Sphingomonas sp. TaxID=28214 RepID=UPI0035655D7E